MSEALLPAPIDRNNLFTREECTQILHNYLAARKGGRLHSYHVIAESEAIGYLGEYFHLYLSYQLNEDLAIYHTRFFVKSMLYQNATMNNYLEKCGLLQKEVTLYKTLLNELRKLSNSIWCAECYLSRKDLFVMRNIADLGFEPMHEPAGYLAPAQMKALLRGLATMHACSIAYEVRNNLNIGVELKHALYEVTVSPTVAWYTAGVRAVTAIALQHPAYQTAERQDFIKNQLPTFVDSAYDMVNSSTKYRNVFCHRDPWGGNVFFSRLPVGEVGSAFVDFQLCRYSPAAVDVAMAIYLNIKPKDRKPIMSELCRHYYRCFTQELQKMDIDADAHLSQAAFEDSFREMQFFGALYNCISATILRVPGDYLKAMKQNRPEDFFRYTNVDRTPEVLELVRTNGEFREYIHDCIEDMLELILV